MFTLSIYKNNVYLLFLMHVRDEMITENNRLHTILRCK